MDAAVTAGFIGLIGAVVGSAATFSGVIYQQRHTARLHAASVQRATVHTAAQQLMREILEVQAVLQRDPSDLDPDEFAQQGRRLREHLSVVLIDGQWLSDSQLRRRLQENAAFVNMSPPGDTRSSVEKRADAMLLCADSIACLGAYVREEPMPSRLRDTEDVLARWPKMRSATWFIEG